MNNENDRRKIAKLLVLARDKSAHGPIRTEARRLANRLLRRHGWKVADLDGYDPDHPGQSIHEIILEGKMSIVQQLTGRFLMDVIPRLTVETRGNTARDRVKFSIPLPGKAEAVAKMWTMQTEFMAVEHATASQDSVMKLDLESFCRGFLQSLGESITAAREELARAREKAEARARKLNAAPHNPLAMILCRRNPPAHSAGPISGDERVSAVRVGGHGAIERAAPPESPPAETPASVPGENHQMDAYSYSIGFQRAKSVSIDGFVNQTL